MIVFFYERNFNEVHFASIFPIINFNTFADIEFHSNINEISDFKLRKICGFEKVYGSVQLMNRWYQIFCKYFETRWREQQNIFFVYFYAIEKKVFKQTDCGNSCSVRLVLNSTCRNRNSILHIKNNPYIVLFAIHENETSHANETAQGEQQYGRRI